MILCSFVGTWYPVQYSYEDCNSFFFNFFFFRDYTRNDFGYLNLHFPGNQAQGKQNFETFFVLFNVHSFPKLMDNAVVDFLFSFSLYSC